MSFKYGQKEEMIGDLKTLYVCILVMGEMSFMH